MCIQTTITNCLIREKLIKIQINLIRTFGNTFHFTEFDFEFSILLYTRFREARVAVKVPLARKRYSVRAFTAYPHTWVHLECVVFCKRMLWTPLYKTFEQSTLNETVSVNFWPAFLIFDHCNVSHCRCTRDTRNRWGESVQGARATSLLYITCNSSDHGGETQW